MRKAPTILLALLIAVPSAALAQPQQSQPSRDIAAVKNLAIHSQCAPRTWSHGRGKASSGYLQGVALVFARSLCHPERADVQVTSRGEGQTNSDDALAWYHSQFAEKGMGNSTPGTDTLRHAYTLLLGLGMMESGGRYCDGRDVSQCFAAADSAEAGLLQTSYGARHLSPTLAPLFQSYQHDQSRCLVSDFGGPLTCKIRKSHNAKCPNATSDVAGSGPGADWQRLTKTCPAFSVEYGAVVMRVHGGKKGEFNPIRKHEAEVAPECDAMLRTVQDYVAAHPAICTAL